MLSVTKNISKCALYTANIAEYSKENQVFILGTVYMLMSKEY